ncbi:MAG TPA: TetR/AcrR family transcriptional regulator [Candidatus Binatia bacterium]
MRTKRGVERGPGSRERILEAASTLLAEGSYAGTSISAICARAAVPPTSIYWHFGSKEGLLGAVVEEGADRWFAGLRPLRQPTGTPHERLEQVLDQLAESLSRQPEFLRLLLTLALERKKTDPACLRTIRRVRKRALAGLQAILEMAFAAFGPARAQAVASELVLFALAFADGAFLAHHIDPRTTDLQRLFGQLRVALLALGDDLAARHERGRR